MAPSPLIGLRRPVPLLAVKAAVDQAGHGARARGVFLVRWCRSAWLRPS